MSAPESLIKAWKLFSSMDIREKITVAILAAVFFVSLGQFIIAYITFPSGPIDDVFVEGMVGRVRIINPLFVDFNDTDRDLSELVFSGLIRFDPEAKNFYPDLAVEWKRSNNGLTYTITLRNNALWHDGQPITVEDVLFTFNDVIKDPGFRNPILKNHFTDVVIEQTGESTITFTLPKANSFFVSALTVGIIPKHILGDTAIAGLEKSPFGQHPVGSGPYQIERVKVNSNDGDVIDLKASETYYGEQPNIKRIRFFTFIDEAKLSKFDSTLHAVSKIKSGSEASQKLSADERFNIFPYSLNQFAALYFNTEKLFVSDRAIRRALARGLNKDLLVLKGEKRVDTLGLEDLHENNEFIFNLEQAGGVLDKLGFNVGVDGVRVNSKNERMTLRLIVDEMMDTSIAESIKTEWAELGVEITIDVLENEEFFKQVSERRYDILLIRQNLGYNRDVYPLFHSSQSGAGLNFSNFKSFRTDGLTEAMRREQNPPDKEKLLIELSKAITDEKPVIFISTPVYSYAIDKRVSAFGVESLDYHSDRLSILPYLQFNPKRP